jgi:hypothetical protein
MVRGWGVLLLLCALAVACRAGELSTPKAASQQAPRTPPAHTPAPSATAVLHEALATPTLSPVPPALPTPTHEPFSAAPASGPDSWYGADTAALFISGDNEQADLFALGYDGSTRLVFPDVGSETGVSPDGRWLGFVHWRDDGRGTLELHDAQSSTVLEIVPDTTSGLFSFAFDRGSSRLAYLDLGAYTDEGVPWALVVVDVESGLTARFDALMAGPETRPLPGTPIGWSGNASQGDELIIDTFLPYTEGGWMGVWAVTLPADGTPAPLAGLAVREVISGFPTYSSRLHLAPDGRDIAFLGRDPDYVPDNYFSDFYDLAVNRIGFAALDDGARTTVVEVSDGGALARALAWSPTGERLLFAQGHYEGESFSDLVLKSSDRSGTVVTYGPLSLPPLGGLLNLVWCEPSRALYVTWDGADGMNRLVGFDLNTGVSSEISAGQRLVIVGCAPE